MPQQWQTVAIPFAEGIKTVANGRVLEQTKLLTAQNCFFLKDQGPQKRYGHLVRPIRAPGTVVALNGVTLPTSANVREPFDKSDPGLGSSYLYGYGLMSLANPSATTGFTTAPTRDVGHTFGGWTRDSQIVAWDGHRAFGVPDNELEPFGEVVGQATMPGLRGAPIAKSLNGQFKPDAVDNGVLRTVAWVNSTGTAYRSVYYSKSGTCVVHEHNLGLATVTNVRVFSMGPWTHILAHNTGDTTLWMYSWHNDDPNAIISRNGGNITSSIFDVKKLDEGSAGIVRIDGGAVKVKAINTDGSNRADWTADVDGDTVVSVAASINASSEIGIAWINNATTAKFNAYNLFNGAGVQATAWTIATNANNNRITISDTYLPTVGGGNSWIVFIQREDLSSTASIVDTYLVRNTNVAVAGITRYNVVIASHSFRVGNRVFLWCMLNPTKFTLQPTWFLCDQQLMPVGKVLFGLGHAPNYTTTGHLPSTNFVTSGSHPNKDRIVFSGALGYRQRAVTSSDSPNPNGVWAEPSVFFYELDFLPRLSSAQAGRSTYIAGAQLWEFDGISLNEAGFHATTEGVGITVGAAGNLDISKTYNYRVELCYKNAQNEEVRSWSKIYTRAGASSGTNKLTLTIPHMPMTRRDGAYFLIFRTEGNGTNYFLVSSRDPSATGDNGFLANSRASKEYTFTDNLSDTLLIANEYHPANATGYLQPLPAPACEVVAAGRDRLWVAGGELSAGEIAPSRYFSPGETPSFSPAVNIQIDRNAEPITAIGFVGEQAVFFRRTSAYTMSGDGPDNIGQGVWPICQLALADVGAISQDTLALAGDGLYFQSPAGIRVITQGGGLRPPGAGLVGGLGTDVDTIAQNGDYSSAVVVPLNSQIRWYSRDPSKPTLVVDYTKNAWTTWTQLSCQKAFYSSALKTVFLFKNNAEVYKEKEGIYLDGDKTYEMIIKTAWLHAASMGDFQRFKRWLLIGNASTGLYLRYRIFYDEREFHGAEGFVTFNDDLNTSHWGDSFWGSGSWGDASNPDGDSGLWFRDNVFRLRKNTERQKCSVFSIEFSDQGSNGDFSPVLLALQLGNKSGLDRLPN